MAKMINLSDLINKANGKKATRKQTAQPEQKALILIPEGTSDNDNVPTLEEIIDTIKGLPGIVMEICGRWLWVSGNTKENKESLKAAGLRWAKKKKMWYYHRPEDSTFGRRTKSMAYIRMKYGSRKLDEEKA